MGAVIGEATAKPSSGASGSDEMGVERERGEEAGAFLTLMMYGAAARGRHLRVAASVQGVEAELTFDTAAVDNVICVDEARRVGAQIDPLEPGDPLRTHGFGDGGVPHVGRTWLTVATAAGAPTFTIGPLFVIERSVPTIVHMNVVLDAAGVDAHGWSEFSVRRGPRAQLELVVGEHVFVSRDAPTEEASRDTLLMVNDNSDVVEVHGDLFSGSFAQLCADLAPETPLAERRALKITARVARQAASWGVCGECGARVKFKAASAHTRACAKCIRAERRRREQYPQRRDGDGPPWRTEPEAPPKATLALRDPLTQAQHVAALDAALKAQRLAGADGQLVDELQAAIRAEPAVSAAFGDKSVSSIPALARVVHRIVLREGADLTRVVARAHKRPQDKQDIIDSYLAQLVQSGRVRPSRSPVASVPVVAPKLNGAGERVGWRVAVDYRALNAQSLHDAYPAPLLRDLVAESAKYPLRSTFDALSQFWSVPLSESSVALTATDFGRGQFFEWLVAPFGLRSMPSTLQRFADSVFNEPHEGAYADDIIINHAHRSTAVAEVMSVLRRAVANGITMNSAKCQLFREEAVLLGYTVGPGRYAIEAAKVLSVADGPRPTSPTELARFTHRVAYFCDSVPRVSMLLAPLRAASGRRGPTAWRLSEAEIAAYDECVAALRTAAPLRSPLANVPWILHTDGGQSGFGYMLYQPDAASAGGIRLLATASRATNQGERNRDAPDREFSAFHWSCLHCAHLLSNVHFVWRCDNSAAVAVSNGSKAAAERLRRQQLSLAAFSFEAEWCSRADARATIVDAMTYAPQLESDGEHRTFLQNEPTTDWEATPSSRVAHFVACVDADPSLATLRRRAAARRRHGALLRPKDGTDVPSTAFYDEGGLLRVCVAGEDGVTHTPCVVPVEYRADALWSAHSLLHVGVAHMEGNAAPRWYWPTMLSDMRLAAQRCQRCQWRRGNQKSALTGLPAGEREPERGEVLGVDFGQRLSFLATDELGATVHESLDILVCVDACSRRTVLAATDSRSMVGAVHAMRTRVLPVLGPPQVIVADQAFNTRLFVDFCATEQIEVVLTPAHATPMRARFERRHAEINAVLADLRDALGGRATREQVVEAVALAERAVNVAYHSALGMSPSEAWSGHRPQDDLERYLGLRMHAHGESIAMRVARQQSRAAARARAAAAAVARRASGALPRCFVVGDLVTVAFPRQRKLQPHTRDGVYRVLAVSDGGTVVYVSAADDVDGARVRAADARQCRLHQSVTGLPAGSRVPSVRSIELAAMLSVSKPRRIVARPEGIAPARAAPDGRRAQRLHSSRGAAPLVMLPNVVARGDEDVDMSASDSSMSLPKPYASSSGAASGTGGVVVRAGDGGGGAAAAVAGEEARGSAARDVSERFRVRESAHASAAASDDGEVEDEIVSLSESFAAWRVPPRAMRTRVAARPTRVVDAGLASTRRHEVAAKSVGASEKSVGDMEQRRGGGSGDVRKGGGGGSGGGDRVETMGAAIEVIRYRVCEGRRQYLCVENGVGRWRFYSPSLTAAVTVFLRRTRQRRSARAALAERRVALVSANGEAGGA